MAFEEILQRGPMMLTEGAVIERLRRDPSMELDPHILHAGYAFESGKREGLGRIFREYLDIGAAFDLPMIVSTPTWRANPERVQLTGGRSCAETNRESARFLDAIRSGYGAYSRKIFIGGLIGCRGDAYDPADSPPIDASADFHAEQVGILAETGVDFLFAATLPAAPEALGIAKAMADHGMPYILSFIIRPPGSLLDGTPLREAISLIDEGADPPPLCYWINCVHPSVFSGALDHETEAQRIVRERVIGLQANTSALPPEALEDRPTLDEEDASAFAASMVRLHARFGTRVLGGCCGTSTEHIRCIAEQIRGKSHE